uniref:Uncharacterized protein n=1 Tax=Alexandrium catenella TaxID=2925 RepID=A0A7S1RIC6_ALECA
MPKSQDPPLMWSKVMAPEGLPAALTTEHKPAEPLTEDEAECAPGQESMGAMPTDKEAQVMRTVAGRSVGRWDSQPAAVGCCLKVRTEYTIQPLQNGRYPMFGSISVLCCRYCTSSRALGAGFVDEDGGRFHHTNTDGTSLLGTCASVDTSAQTVMYSLSGRTGSSETISGYSVEDGLQSTMTLSVGGHYVVIQARKVG